jgi:hypothetical protein
VRYMCVFGTSYTPHPKNIKNKKKDEKMRKRSGSGCVKGISVMLCIVRVERITRGKI